ncbi:MAG: ECF transporter S component [Clostridia bacterium]|nr:ECF transporter S component [Clostridia bacterium]
MKHSEIRTHEKIRRLVLAAVFAALSCVATMLIQIPSPMNGYVNMGDCFVLLGALFLGPVWGALAGGLGSMLADLFTGYAHYAPGTFLIKALMALVLYGIYRSLTAGKLPRNAAYLIGAAAAELVMVVGYFCYASLLLGKGLAAASSIPGNLMQGVFGVIASFLLMQVFARMKGLRELL